MTSARRTLVHHRGFLEAARWRDGALHLSDIYLHEVLRVSPAGEITVLATVEHEPSGLGWRPDGTMLIVSVEDRRLLALDASGATRAIADLSGLAAHAINDMVVDAAGHAFVGQVGFDRHAGPLQDVGSVLIRVDPDDSVHVAAEDLHVANGMVVTPDQRTLIVAESLGRCITAFDLAADGTLSNRRVWAEVESIPDGICLDREGLLWVAFPHLSSFRRIAEGGRVVDEIPVEGKAVCCVLGGDDGRDLFLLCTTEMGRDAATANPLARVEVARVEVPSA